MPTKPRDTADLSTLDELLSDEGTLEQFQAAAIKEVLALQIEQAMKDPDLSSPSAAPSRR